jgi:hypothetical protein
MKMNARSVSFVSWLVVLISGAAWCAEPRVELVLSDDAPPLEKFAANELRDQLQRLFAADVHLVTSAGNTEHTILIGSPTTNPAVRKAAGDQWPELSDQGHLLRTVTQGSRSVLLVGGGSPQATLWAVYELGHRFGIRSLLQGDFLPIERRPLSLADLNVVLEPQVRIRAWQTLDGGPIGWEAWGREDHLRLLRQLAKQKINRIVLTFGAEQPWFHFEAASVPKTAGVLFGGRNFTVDGDTAGRTVFRGAKLFENPAFLGQTTYAERLAAGKKLVQSVMDSAHELGMSVAIRLAPLEFPIEIATRLAKGDEKQRLEGASSQLRACVEHYPKIDAVYLELPRNNDPQNNSLALNGAVKWHELVMQLAPPKRSVEINFLVANTQQSHRLRNRISHWGKTPRDAGVVLVKSSQVAGQGDSTLPGDSVIRRQILAPLSNGNVGVLPQLTVTPLQAIATAKELDGWILQSRVPSDVELSAYYLARAAFDSHVTPKETSDELITTIAGPGVFERLWKGFEMVEKATQLIEQNSPNFASPVPNVITQHAQPAEPAPKWWAEVRDLYTEAMNEMYRGNTRAREGGRSFILYYARRYEFGLSYMTSLEAVRQAAIAKAKGDSAGHVQNLEAAMEGMYNALGAFSEVARDPSDRGVIAVLNEFGYRRLSEELQMAD